MRTANGKGNNARKLLSYYRVNFGISPPYQVLCDGPTIFQSLKNDLYLKQALPTLLGGTAYPVVTNCIVSELRCLGEDYTNAALFAKRATRVPCSHDGVFGANECVAARVNTPFETNLLLATNDVEVLKQVAKTPGIPLITIANQTKLALKGPSRATLEHVLHRENVKSNSLSRQDRALLEKLQADDSHKITDARVTRKRKRAKAPNPLSMKKAKTTKAKNHVNVQTEAQNCHDKENVSFAFSKVQSKAPATETPATTPLENEDSVSDGNHTRQTGEKVSSTPIQRGKRKRKRKKPTQKEVDAMCNGSQELDTESQDPKPDDGDKLSRTSAITGINANTELIPCVAAGKGTAPDEYPNICGLSQNVPSEVAPRSGERQRSGQVNKDLLTSCGTESRSGTVPKVARNPEDGPSRTMSIVRELKMAERSGSSVSREKLQRIAEPSLPVERAKPERLDNERTAMQAAAATKKQRKNRRRRPKKN